VVTDKGVLRRQDAVLRVAAVPVGAGSVEDRIRAFVASCGYRPDIARDVEELSEVNAKEVLALREFDRERLFLE
jgi:hypothetical protein